MGTAAQSAEGMSLGTVPTLLCPQSCGQGTPISSDVCFILDRCEEELLSPGVSSTLDPTSLKCYLDMMVSSWQGWHPLAPIPMPAPLPAHILQHNFTSPSSSHSSSRSPPGGNRNQIRGHPLLS